MTGIGILILAAGASSRFGNPKALAAWGQGTMINHALVTASEVPQATLLVVLGGHAQALQNMVQGTDTVFNADWEQGLGTSIACGMRRLMAGESPPDIVIILPVDQPLITSAHLVALAELAGVSQRCAFTRDGTVTGPPAAIPASYFSAVARLTGDKGLKFVLLAEDMVFRDGPHMLADIDTVADLDRVKVLAATYR